MAKVYLERLSAIVDQSPARSRSGVRLACRHFFSGAALYADGKMCASLTPVGFAVKLPETLRAALLKERRARRLRYFVNGPIKKEYVLLARAIVADPVERGHWLTTSIGYVADRPKPRQRLGSS